MIVERPQKGKIDDSDNWDREQWYDEPMRVGVSSFLTFDITGFAPGRTNAGWPDAGWRVHRHYVYHLLVFLPKYVFGSPWLVSRLSMMDLYFLSDSSASSCSCSSNFRLWSRVTSLATICA